MSIEWAARVACLIVLAWAANAVANPPASAPQPAESTALRDSETAAAANDGESKSQPSKTDARRMVYKDGLWWYWTADNTWLIWTGTQWRPFLDLSGRNDLSPHSTKSSDPGLKEPNPRSADHDATLRTYGPLVLDPYFTSPYYQGYGRGNRSGIVGGLGGGYGGSFGGGFGMGLTTNPNMPQPATGYSPPSQTGGPAGD